MKPHAPPFLLRDLKIEVTHRCTLACIHCSSDASPENGVEMLEPDCLRIIEEAAGMGVVSLAFSGGEPLLWQRFDRAVAAAARSGMKVTVYTAGNVDHFAATISILKAAGLSRCVFSVFGSSAVVHERVTRFPGSFERTIASVRAAQHAGLEVEFHFVPFAETYRQLEGICLFGRELGVTSVSVLRFVPQGRGMLFRKHALSRLQSVDLRAQILSLRKRDFSIRVGSPFNYLRLGDSPHCFSAIDRLIVGPNLRVFPCDAFKQVQAEDLVGTNNLSILSATCSLAQCWDNSPFLLAIRKYLTTDFEEPCVKCAHLENCASGCLAQKVLGSGDLRKRPDPDCLVRT